MSQTIQENRTDILPDHGISSDHFSMQVPQYAMDVLETLEQNGYEAWFAGGCVRDALMGIEPHDYDIASSASPAQVQALFEKTIDTGAKHGTITVMSHGMPVEVTTFRKEDQYTDHRHPEQVEFVRRIEEDLARRDFTINAMAWNPKHGLLDPYGGRQDLDKKIIRAVGDPKKRFEEDALRMLRAWRFAARLGFDVEEETRKAIDACAGLTSVLSAERVVSEMEEILETNPGVIAQMTALLRPWIPELEKMKDCEQNSPYHYADVLTHTLDALKHLKPYDSESAWAILLHDTGKPEVKQNYGGKDHFKKHELASEKIARRVVRDLKLPAKYCKEIPVLVKMHDTFYAPRPVNLYKLRVQRGLSDELAERLFAVQYCDIMAHKTLDRLKDWEAFKTYYEKNRDAGLPMEIAALPLNGRDIMDHTSLKGKQIHEAQLSLLRMLMEHPENNNYEKALALLPEIEKAVLQEESREQKQKGQRR